MTDDITKFIAASREVCDAATPGPWCVGADETCEQLIYNGNYSYDAESRQLADADEPLDARFIAHARTALPKALDYLEHYCAGFLDQKGNIEEKIEAIAALKKQIAEQQEEIDRLEHAIADALQLAGMAPAKDKS